MEYWLIGGNILCLFALGWRAWHLEGKLADEVKGRADDAEAHDANRAMHVGIEQVLRRENFILNRRNVSITNELRGSDDRALTVALPDLKPSPVQWTPDPGQRTFP
jgi:hypothetical protein